MDKFGKKMMPSAKSSVFLGVREHSEERKLSLIGRYKPIKNNAD